LADFNIADLMLQCMSIHYRLAPALHAWLGCPVLYTIGWVDDGTERGVFKFGDDFIDDELQNGLGGGKINLHVWLTLPGMEIIDAALATTYAELHGLKEGRGGVLAMRAYDVRDMAYKPMLVGADFLRKAGVLFDI
jgi:hypothetical protein